MTSQIFVAVLGPVVLLGVAVVLAVRAAAGKADSSACARSCRWGPAGTSLRFRCADPFCGEPRASSFS